jgi:hypothetical protein
MKMIGGRLRAAILLGVSASVLVFTAGADAQNQNSPFQNGDSWVNPPASDNPWPYNTPQRSAPVIAVVGDIACQPGEEAAGESTHETCTDAKSPYTTTSLYQSQEATANQIEAMKPDAVALLGDLQYQVGKYTDFESSYDLTYGAFKMITRPSPGNHEFYDEHGETGVAGYGYFSYFNGFQIDTNNDANLGKPVTTTIPDPCPSNSACGPGATPTLDLTPQPVPRPDGQAGHFQLGANGGQNGTGVGDGWYSYNIGSWHLISLNIECSTQPGGCSTTDPSSWLGTELAWLQKDLEANHSPCTLAYWHQPTFSAANGITPEGIAADAFWQLLYDQKADLVLNGHDHLYARYRPLNPSGNFDPEHGLTEFIVGTGGETLDAVVTTAVTSGSGETNLEDPRGNTNFNAENLKAATGDYWGVMALTLNHDGYAWNYTSAMPGPANNGQWPAVAPTGTYTDQGVGTCHAAGNR